MNNSAKIKMIIIGVVALTLLIVGIKTIGVVKVEGDEAYTRQNLWEGVLPTLYRDGTHFYCGWVEDVYKYNIGTQKCTFAEKSAEHPSTDYTRIEVNVGENGGQSAWISLSMNYRLGWDVIESVEEDGTIVTTPKFNPDKIVALHKDGLQKTYQDVIIKRTVFDVVNRLARPRQALEIYSGQGFVKFAEDVTTTLQNHPVFRDRGIFIENVTIYQVSLNPAYEKEIEEKQLAKQKKLREVEEKLAAEERAKRVFAEAQAEVETRTQAAEASKIERIKKAEAEKIEQVMMAEGKRDSDLAKSSGLLAIGKAEAEVEMLKRDAKYSGEAGQRRADVEIAKARAEKLAGIFKGVMIVPEKTILQAGAGAGLVVNPSEQ